LSDLTVFSTCGCWRNHAAAGAGRNLVNSYQSADSSWREGCF